MMMEAMEMEGGVVVGIEGEVDLGVAEVEGDGNLQLKGVFTILFIAWR